jgi:aminopeptidase-like protein
LGKCGLYSRIGGQIDGKHFEMALLWVLNFSDYKHSLLEIAKTSGLGFDVIRNASDTLLEANLLKEL